jgi:glycolate dehydrogenase iron-sulfur subunit
MTTAQLAREEIADGLVRCIHCGMCLEACPTYRVSRLETESPRGRLHLMSALLDGRVSAESPATEHLDRCLACRACEAVCPSGVPYGMLIENARATLEEARAPERSPLVAWWRRLLLRNVIGDPAVLSAVAGVLSLYDRLGIKRVVRSTGLTNILPPSLRRLESMSMDLSRPAYRPPAKPAAPRARVALLLGCVMRVAYGDVHTATGRLLAAAGVEVVDAPGQLCCGALHAHAGDRVGAVTLARRNIEAFEAANVDAVVVDAAGCGAHTKAYAHVAADGDPGWAERGAALAAKVRDVTEYLADLPSPAPLRLRMRVTYQDPCHLAHAQGIRRQPRELLSRIEGLEVVEMADSDVCCGSAGSYSLLEPEYSDRLLERKIDAVLATGAEAVVTANPGCMQQLAAGLVRRGVDLPVLHVVEVLAKAATP